MAAFMPEAGGRAVGEAGGRAVVEAGVKAGDSKPSLLSLHWLAKSPGGYLP